MIRDLAKYETGQLLNDTCIEFYMHYIMQEMLHEQLRGGRVHMFNTFFYS
jgi:Ulp1 family protease